MKHIYTFLFLFLFSGVAVADDYYEKGEKAYRSGQYEEALDWFRKSAQAGYGQGQLIYGHMLYSNGQAPLENKTEASIGLVNCAVRTNN